MKSKKMFQMRLMTIIFIFGINVMSCTKEGAVGPQGPAGTNGTNGTNGINGNANVLASNTVTINNWVSSYDNGVNYLFESTLTWAGITQAIKDNGAVMVYWQSGSDWFALPYTDAGDTYSTGLNFSFSVGTVKIEVTGWDTPSPNPSDFNGMVIRVVAISASSKAANPNVNWKNYKEVKQVLNLKD